MNLVKFEEKYYKDTYEVYAVTIRYAFEGEGLGHLEDDICSEIAYKEALLRSYLNGNADNRRILVATDEAEKVIGTISFGPLGKEILDCVDADFPAEGELGGLYILPHAQGKGAGSALIGGMLEWIKADGISQYALDSGYKNAQKRWLQKFGQPYTVAKDYWGPGFDHMVWLCAL